LEESRKQGSKEAKKQRSKEAKKQRSKEARNADQSERYFEEAGRDIRESGVGKRA
jgi:hypothetical protein